MLRREDGHVLRREDGHMLKREEVTQNQVITC